VLIMVSFLLVVLGVLADLSGANRELIEEGLYLLRRHIRATSSRSRDD